MKLTAYILEDEQLAKNRLIRMLEEISPEISVVDSFESVEDIVKKLSEESHPDLLFLDIHVADGISMELFHILEVKSKVIFTTAYDDYAIEAFRKNAIDYLLKPIKKIQLVEAVQKAKMLLGVNQQHFSTEYKNRLLVKFGKKLTSLKTKDLAYIYSKNKIVYFVCFNREKYPSDYKLQELEKLLDPSIFFRANRQFITHVDAISGMIKHDSSRIKLTLNPDIEQEIVISTEKAKSFKDWLKK